MFGDIFSPVSPPAIDGVSFHITPTSKVRAAQRNDHPEEEVEDGGDQHAFEVEPEERERGKRQIICRCAFGERQGVHDLVKDPQKIGSLSASSGGSPLQRCGVMNRGNTSGVIAAAVTSIV